MVAWIFETWYVIRGLSWSHMATLIAAVNKNDGRCEFHAKVPGFLL